MNSIVKTVIGALVLSLALTGISFAKSAPKVTATPVVAETDTTYQIRLLFTKDGCAVYEFYSNGVAHTLVTGKTSFCALAN